MAGEGVEPPNGRFMKALPKPLAYPPNARSDGYDPPTWVLETQVLPIKLTPLL